MRRLFIVWALFTILISGCKHNPVVPPPTKDMRALKWKVDTISYPSSFQLTMTRMWASSAQNIYIVGPSDSPDDKTMFHFDGRTWSTTGFHSSDGGPVVGTVELADVFGFGPNDVWAVGGHLYSGSNRIFDSTLIVHYNGVAWNEYKVNGAREISAIWGSSPNDIWACGYNTVLHYDGSVWKKDTLYLPGSFIQLGSVCGSTSGDLLMIGFRYDVTGGMGIENFFLYRHFVHGWDLIDSSHTGAEKYGATLGSVDGNIYSVYHGVWQWTAANWQLLARKSWLLAGIGGVSENNLFVCGGWGGLFHYNGVDWYQIPQISSVDIVWTDIWTDGTTVVVLGSDGSKSYVARGE